MTSKELRQSFLDFFREKEHTIVPSSSLMPASPNLKFTNAGMNQFVPYFLGTEKAPYDPPRAADTQKCIRAGGKHNDLEDVGYDTYHHTFFEMLGNWSFGNYFKKEAIAWAWELVVERWGFPANRLYATVYSPAPGDPSVFDQEAFDHWAKLFTAKGLDPKVHIVNGNKKDNFWAMGDTGPCGPCSELHVDLTPAGDTKGSLVNMGDARCIEIWNLVFIQFNCEEDKTYRPLPAQHVDTGMGFERACSIMQCTNGFQDFTRLCSNYDTDVFKPIFDKLASLCGKTYTGTVPLKRDGLTEQEQYDVAFRVIGDHIRTISFAIADGILPDNKDRNSVIRAILRRAVRFGRELGMQDGDPFLPKLVPTLVECFGEEFPEIRAQQAKIMDILDAEERSFNRTLSSGLRLFESEVRKLGDGKVFPSEMIVKLWETFGFPVELTKVLLDERALTYDKENTERLVEEHKSTGSGGAANAVVRAVNITTDVVSKFTGYESDSTEAKILRIVEDAEQIIAIVDQSPLYVEKGGQLGDYGTLISGNDEIPILGSSTVGEAICLHLDRMPTVLDKVTIHVDQPRRRDIEKHHTATHLMHWALHESVDKDASQQGSLVAPDRLRFDFHSKALTPGQVTQIEHLVNARIAQNDGVSWKEVPYLSIKGRPDIMQFFGDKYGETVRVVQIGGETGSLNGYSMELCAGTHVRNTKEIELFAIKSEGAIAAGTRRIEALCGQAAREYLKEATLALETEVVELAKEATALAAGLKLDESYSYDIHTPCLVTLTASGMDSVAKSLRQWRDAREDLKGKVVELKKQIQKSQVKERAKEADALLGQWIEDAVKANASFPVIVNNFPEGDGVLLQEALNGLKKRQFNGVGVLTAIEADKVHIGIYVADALTGKVKAGSLMGELAPVVGGRGGGSPAMAKGAGTEPSKVGEFAQQAKARLAQLA